MMKKVTYLFVLMFSLVLMSTSCEKDPVTPDQTLEQMYPDWKNLTWISTDGQDITAVPAKYPRLNITIVGNVVSINQPYDSPINGQPRDYNGTYDAILFQENTVAFGLPASVTGTYVKNGDKITITTFGLMNKTNPINSHTYVLKINNN